MIRHIIIVLIIIIYEFVCDVIKYPIKKGKNSIVFLSIVLEVSSCCINFYNKITKVLNTFLWWNAAQTHLYIRFS